MRRRLPRRRAAWTGLLVVVLAAAAAAVYLSSRPAARTRSVPASIAADCSHPVDAEINRFLASVPDGYTVRFAAGGCYRQADSLWLRRRRDIVLDGNGATFAFDTTTGLTRLYRSNWRILGGAGITLENMTVRGACRPRQCGNGSPPPARDGYGQHGINLESTAHPTVDHVHVVDVLSDGIEAEGTLDPACCWRGPATSDLVIRDSHVERAGRQLIGITDLDGGLIEGNRIEDGPEVGIDIEVDVPGFTARHLRIAGNTFDDVHSSIISNGGLGADPQVADVTIEGNTMARRSAACSGGIYLRAPGPNPQGYRTGFAIRENTFKLIGPMLQAQGIRDLTVAGNTTGYQEVGCGEKGAVELTDSHNVAIAGNDFRGYPRAVYADPASSAITSGP
jgi:hypothetical protein